MVAEEQRLLVARRADYAKAQERSNQAILFLVILGSCGILVGGAATVAAIVAGNARKQSAVTAAERLRLLNMVDFVPVMMLDLRGIVRFWSEGCRMLYGWTAEQAIGRSSRELLQTVASVPLNEMEAQLLRTGEWSGELCHRAQNGETVTVLAHKVLQRNADGARSGDNLTVIDVTRLRRTETALLASETRFHAVVDAATDAIIIADFEGGIHDVNPAVLRMFGYDHIDELIGHDLAMLMPATEAARHPGYIANHRAGTPSRAIGVKGRELLAIRRDGTEFPIELSVGSFGLDDHQYLTGIIRDISDRRRGELALLDSEAQLRQAMKMEVIGRLAAGVAHDFNNVIQCVAGGLELVLDDVAADSPARQFGDIAMRSARRGADLTQNLLAYARKQALEPRSLAVAPFLSEMRLLLSRTLGQHISIKVQAADDLPPIYADLGQLQTAVLNLAINSAYAMPSDGTLSLEARIDSGHEEYIVITVTDTGVGMDEATLAQVFEPFFTTKGRDGTGLGLPMVQGFAEQSGGALHIESAPGKGTKVEIRLPAARLGIAADQQQTVPTGLRGSHRILLVDDIEDVLVTTGAFLERSGGQVVLARSGYQALGVLSSGEQFDALVTDYDMPAMNGVDLITRARLVQPGLAAVIISGFAGGDSFGGLPDATAFLRKPFQRQQLIEAVLRAVEQKCRLAGSTGCTIDSVWPAARTDAA
jgi:PAS domain S-box-containing protein